MSVENNLETFIQESKSRWGRADAELKLLNQRLDTEEVRRARPDYSDGGRGGMQSLCENLASGMADLQRTGRVRFETPSLLESKSVLLSTGLVAPPALAIAPGPRPENRLRSVFRTYPIGTGAVYKITETGNYLPASPVSEGDPKSEATVTLTGTTLPVETIAHYVNVSKQALDDVEGLQAFLNQTLLYGLENQVENQIINGTGGSPALDGLIDGAEAFDTSLLFPADGYERPDYLAASAAQLRIAGFNCDCFVVSGLDWYLIETLKDTTARYLIGDARGSLPMILWNRNIIVSPSMAEGYFLALDSSRFHIRQRQQATVEVSFEHASNFTSNLATIRVEERLAFVKGQDSAAVYGQFVTSPL